MSQPQTIIDSERSATEICKMEAQHISERNQASSLSLKNKENSSNKMMSQNPNFSDTVSNMTSSRKATKKTTSTKQTASKLYQRYRKLYE